MRCSQAVSDVQQAEHLHYQVVSTLKGICRATDGRMWVQYESGMEAPLEPSALDVPLIELGWAALLCNKKIDSAQGCCVLHQLADCNHLCCKAQNAIGSCTPSALACELQSKQLSKHASGRVQSCKMAFEVIQRSAADHS